MGNFQVVVMILVFGHFRTDFLNVAADVNIIEARETQICSYAINDSMMLESNPNCFLAGLQFVVAIATDVRQQLLFFTDAYEGKIFRVSLAPGSQPVRTVLYGLGSVEGIAVDWLAQNLFWTDFNLNHICVSRYDGTDRRILIDDDVLNPRGIVVHPFEGWIFWTDLRGVQDAEGRIERANMNGTERVAIVNNRLTSPNALVIDFTTNRLFFADRGTDKIESVTFDGTNRRTIYEQNGADFFDITIYGDHLYATIWRSTEADGQVTVLRDTNQNPWEVVQTIDHDNQALGITTLDVSVQPEELQGEVGTCGDVDGECEHLCLPVGSTNRTCACATGYSLDVDGQSCKTEHTSEYFLLVADSSLNGIYQIDGASDFQVSAVPLDDLVFPVSLGYDHVSGMMYWSDRSRSAIGRAFLDGSYQETILFGNSIGDPGGIALDTRRRLIYWTNDLHDTISMAGIDGNIEPTVFIDVDLDQPRAIAVNLLNGDVYWTDWGMNAKIERVSAGGTNREVLVDDRLGWPNCLAIDSEGELLYWCDAQFDRLEVSSLDGNNRRVLVLFDQEAHPFSMAIFGEYIYWTDWTKHRLVRANRWTGAGVQEVGSETFLRLQGLAAYELIDVLEVTSPQETSSAATSESTPPASPAALNVTLIAAAAGGGLAFVLILIFIICCAVRCARSSGGSKPPKDDHVPMSVRSTSFAGSYDPSGVPGPRQLNNNPYATKVSPDHPPPLPPGRPKEEPIYQDIDDYMKPDGEAAYQAYLNPTFKGNGDGSQAGKLDSFPAGKQNSFPAGKQDGFPAGKQDSFPAGKQDSFPAGKQDGFPAGKQDSFPAGKQDGFPAGNGDRPTERYINSIVKQKPSVKPKPKPKPKPLKPAQTAISSNDSYYLQPQLPEQDYMDLKVPIPQA